MASIKAWHFLPEMGKLSHGDKRPVVVGKTLTTKGTIIPCENGLHASRRITDALSYRAGPILCRVECSGDVIEAETKLVCRRRKCLSMHDITGILRVFAIDCAERSLRFTQDKRAHAAVKAARDYLAGKIELSELNNARDAADAAAYTAYTAYTAAAADAADAAAYTAYTAYTAAANAANAAYAAAYTAAYAAANAAANAAYAARVKARQEERDWQEDHLLELIKDL